MPGNCSDTTIMTPTLNEEENIGQSITTVTKRYPGVSEITCPNFPERRHGGSKMRARHIPLNPDVRNQMMVACLTTAA